MHIFITKNLRSSLPFLSSAAFSFVFHCCQIVFHQLNWLSICSNTSRSHIHIIFGFLPSVVFMFLIFYILFFFKSRISSLIFFLGSSGVVVWTNNCWALNVEFPFIGSLNVNTYIQLDLNTIEFCSFTMRSLLHMGLKKQVNLKLFYW